jgi:hypothetical protein
VQHGAVALALRDASRSTSKNIVQPPSRRASVASFACGGAAPSSTGPRLTSAPERAPSARSSVLRRATGFQPE